MGLVVCFGLFWTILIPRTTAGCVVLVALVIAAVIFFILQARTKRTNETLSGAARAIAKAQATQTVGDE
jgi:hypothetical protein